VSLPTIGTIVLALAVAVVLGGALLRLGGGLLFWAGALGLTCGSGPLGLLLVGFGAGLWLLGRLHRSLQVGSPHLPDRRPGRLNGQAPARGPADRGGTGRRRTGRRTYVPSSGGPFGADVVAEE
jgi:hypothetical protein